MTVRLTPSVFSHPGAAGDFSWMIERPEWQHTFFIFNDNETQSRAFLEQVASGDVEPHSLACQAGGGNAVIRPYQCRMPPRAAGVPTGPGYASLTPQVTRAIDDAIAYIVALLASDRFTEVIYSASRDDPSVLGHGIFRVGEDVLRYIPAELERAVSEADAR